MINSFRRMRTGKRTGDGEADGGRGSGRGTGKRTEAAAAVRAVRLFGRRRLSSPAWPAASGAKPPPQQEPAAFFFLCCCFCGCRLSAAAAGSHPTDDGKIPRLVQQKRPQVVQLVGLQQPAAELNFEMLIIVNNKFVDELAFVVFVFKNLGGTV